MLRQRQAVYRSAKWLEAVRKLDRCVLCGAHEVQAAHRNQGKGMGQKVDDCLTAALCPTCHAEIDNGKSMGRDERRARLDDAICKTVVELARNGWLEIRV